MRAAMLPFTTFLTEDRTCSGNINEFKTPRHLRNYVFPYLSADEKAAILKVMGKRMPFKEGDDEDGEFYKKGRKFTHTVLKKFNGVEPGTTVKISGIDIHGYMVHVKTDKGEIPLTKIGIPEELKREQKTQSAFDVEEKIRRNLGGGGGQGSVGKGLDYVYGNSVRGAARQAEKVGQGQGRYVRGESKAVKGKFGQVTLRWSKETGRWSMSPSPMENDFKQARVRESGLLLINHLNRFYPDGIITDGFSADAPSGMSRRYFASHEGGSINFIHIFLTGEEGTTYSIGDKNKLKGLTGCAHLSRTQIDKLDQTIHIDATHNGKTYATNKPRQAEMNRLAKAYGQDRENNVNLWKEEDANVFMQRVDEASDAQAGLPQGQIKPREEREKEAMKTGPVEKPEINNDSPGGAGEFYGKHELRGKREPLIPTKKPAGNGKAAPKPAEKPIRHVGYERALTDRPVPTSGKAILGKSRRISRPEEPTKKKIDYEAIKRHYETNDKDTREEIAKKFGVSHGLIWYHASKEGWKRPSSYNPRATE